jgi:hypothetical protein
MRTARFNGIALGELSVNFLEQPSKVVAKGAFINTQSGATHGWTTCQQWSPDTLAKLKELRELMEQDMAAVHFADSGYGVIAPATTTRSSDLGPKFQGLGERLGTAVDDVPQAGEPG